jgi:hypothetical protein
MRWEWNGRSTLRGLLQSRSRWSPSSFSSYGRDLKNHKQLRAGVLAFVVASFVAAEVAGFFGAMLDKYAPMQGGQTIQLSKGEAR